MNTETRQRLDRLAALPAINDVLFPVPREIAADHLAAWSLGNVPWPKCPRHDTEVAKAGECETCDCLWLLQSGEAESPTETTADLLGLLAAPGLTTRLASTPEPGPVLADPGGEERMAGENDKETR